MADLESRDDEAQPSASVEQATALLWKAVTAQNVPSADSVKYQAFYKFCEAMANAASVKALKTLDKSAGRR